METRLEYAINEIDIKIESFKIDLDILVNNINTSLIFIQETINEKERIKDLKQQLKKSSIDPKTIKYLINFYKTLKNIHKIEELNEFDKEFRFYFNELNQFFKLYQRKSSASHSNSTMRTRNLLSCEKLVKKFKQLSQTHEKIFVKRVFMKSTYIFKNSIIGKFIDPNLLSLNSIEHSKPKIIKMEQFKSLRNLCALDDTTLLISDSKSNTIYSFNKNYEIDRCLSNIQNERFEYPVGICTDEVNIFICDHNNNRIIVTDRKLQNINYIFGSYGKEAGKFDCPIEACSHGSSLFILDRGNRRIQEFSFNGTFLRILKLYKLEMSSKGEVEIVGLTFPLSFKMGLNKIAVLNTAKVYIYDLQGSLIQTLSPNNIKCICFVNDNLFTFNNDGYLTCFAKTLNYELAEAYSHRFETLRPFQITYMALFNENLVLCADTSKNIFLI